jgi:hypothetical protein
MVGSTLTINKKSFLIIFSCVNSGAKVHFFLEISKFFIYKYIKLIPFTRTSSVLHSLNHDLELGSSSFTLGRTRTSSVLHSLNHDLFAVDDIDTLGKLRG